MIAAFQMSADLGAVIGPLVAGWLADEYSFGAAFGVTAGVLAAGLVAALLSKETQHRREAAATRAGTRDSRLSRRRDGQGPRALDHLPLREQGETDAARVRTEGFGWTHRRP